MMKKHKQCFFYLINFILIAWLFPVSVAFAQQRCIFYANQETHNTPGTSSISNPNAAVMVADTTDYSTLNTPLNALGILSANQNLMFTAAGAANTPLVVKIGGVANTLAVANQITIQAYNNNTAVNPAILGSALLTMLSSSGNSRIRLQPQGAYNNVRIILNSTLSLGYSINIF